MQCTHLLKHIMDATKMESLYILPSSNETLPLMFVIACSFPQLVLLLSVAYRQLKGKLIA